jgi:hypothetical protein
VFQKNADLLLETRKEISETREERQRIEEERGANARKDAAAPRGESKKELTQQRDDATALTRKALDEAEARKRKLEKSEAEARATSRELEEARESIKFLENRLKESSTTAKAERQAGPWRTRVKQEAAQEPKKEHETQAEESWDEQRTRHNRKGKEQRQVEEWTDRWHRTPEEEREALEPPSAVRRIWARKYPSFKEGDWECPSCGDHQFRRNLKCRKCGGARPGLAKSVDSEEEDNRTKNHHNRSLSSATRSPAPADR